MPLTSAMRNSQLVDRTVPPARAMMRHERSYSDEPITPELSLTVSAVLAAFTILTEDLASLPLILYARRGRNKFRAYDSLYYRLMHDQPNPEHTSMIFREFISGHLLAWGNFYGQLIVDKRGDVQEIWPLRPDRMTVERVDGQKIYKYLKSDGKYRVFMMDELVHIPAFGFDGLIGYSRISLARNAIGLSISAEKFGSKFYANGANVGIVYKHPGTLGDTAYTHLNDSLKDRTGVNESHKPIILEEGMSIEKLGIPPDDAQFLETRKFQVNEIARIFRVPPHMIGDVEKTTSWGSGIDSQEQGYVNHTLRPWAKRIEEQLNARVLLPQDRATYFYEHLMDGLLRGDIATRYSAYVQAINNGILSPNEARAKENLNPYKQGDVYWRPLNMASVTDPMQDNTSTEAQLSIDAETAQPDKDVLMPLWMDAITRVTKREQNDVLGAARRFGKRNDAEGFRAWAAEFYRHDHTAFTTKQFKPLVDAEMRVSGQDLSKSIDARMFQYLSGRMDVILNLSIEEIEAEFEKTTGVDELMEFIFDAEN